MTKQSVGFPLCFLFLFYPTAAWPCIGGSPNGVVEGIEECDIGAGCSDIAPDTCRTDCTLPSCGDGVTDSGEDCDDNPHNSNELPNVCRTNCRFPYCGDGVIDTNYYEQCDRGPNNGNSYCSTTCRIPYCGNGVIDSGEECDWGPDNSNLVPDRCRLDCQDPTCGDFVQDSGEQCDYGTLNSDFVPNACRGNCQLPTCGDGLPDTLFGEECDLGAGNANDGSSECRLDCSWSYCGNSAREGSEVCDDGNADEDVCTDQCRPNVCGDERAKTSVENCDATGSCDYACFADFELCGNGAPDDGEDCDEGVDNSNEPDATCRTDCLSARCGDGIVDAGEECDRGELCAPDCTKLREP